MIENNDINILVLFFLQKQVIVILKRTAWKSIAVKLQKWALYPIS